MRLPRWIVAGLLAAVAPASVSPIPAQTADPQITPQTASPDPRVPIVPPKNFTPPPPPAPVQAVTPPAALTPPSAAAVQDVIPDAAPPRPTRTPVPTGSPDALNLFFIGNRRSQLEPCGCHTKQQGGVQYEAVLYEQRNQNPGLRVDAGEWSDPYVDMSPVYSMQTRYLLRALTMLDFDAVNMGASDMIQDKAFYENIREKYPEALARVISANVFYRDKPDRLVNPPYRIVTRKLGDGREIKIGITGVTTIQVRRVIDRLRTPAPLATPQALKVLETTSYLAKDPVECLMPVVEELRPKVDLLVVLYAGDFPSTVDLAKVVPTVDFIVTTGRTNDVQVPIARSGNVQIVCVHNTAGKELGFVSLRRTPTGVWVPLKQPEWLYVAMDVPPDPKLMGLMAEFKQETRTLEKIPDTMQLKNKYAGSYKCQRCHVPEYQDWQQTRHAHALQTLIDKGQQFNPACLKCHVVGFQDENGFWSVRHNPSQTKFNVQCESCHGVAEEHSQLEQRVDMFAKQKVDPQTYQTLRQQATEARPRKIVPETVCVQCHTPENDATWNYALKLPKVKHAGAKPPASATPAAGS